MRARLDRVDHVNVFATLLEDDSDETVAPFKAGEAGIWHGHSFVETSADFQRNGQWRPTSLSLLTTRFWLR